MMPTSIVRKFTKCSAALSVLLAPALSAQVVSYQFEGVVTGVTDAGGLLPVDIVVGTPFSGSLSYDVSNVVDSNGSETQGRFWFSGAAADDFFMAVTLGAHTLSLNPETPLPNTIYVVHDSYHEVDHNARYPLLNGATPPGTLGDWDMSLILDDSTATALSSDALPVAPLSLDSFTGGGFLFHAYNGADTYSIFGEITTLHPVPEPTAGALALAGAGGLWLVRRRKSVLH